MAVSPQHSMQTMNQNIVLTYLMISTNVISINLNNDFALNLIMDYENIISKMAIVVTSEARESERCPQISSVQITKADHLKLDR